MGNREKVLSILQLGQPLCDECLTIKANIVNNATTNQICRQLASEGLAVREQGFCPGEKKYKLVTRLIDTQKPVLLHLEKEQTAETTLLDNVKDKWYWEGNVQNKIVEHLLSCGFQVLKAANTATKEAGVDITAISPELRRYLISVKGYPFEHNKNRNTQARHWFGQALFDLILYRENYPEVFLGIGLPDSFQTYISLANRVTWFRKSLPFSIYWVDENGGVKVE